jgi:hypothetical protein
MKQTIKFIAFFIVVGLSACNSEVIKLRLIEAKSKEKTILFPEPFVFLRNAKKEIDPVGASQISNWIKTETDSEISKQLTTIHVPISNDTEYYRYGNELSELMYYCQQKGIGDTVQIGEEINKMINKYPDDLCLLVLNFCYSRSSVDKSNQIAASVATGLVTGLLTGIAITPGFNITSNIIHIAVYSKSKKTILYYDHDEDKDDPAIKKNTIEEISTLLKDLLQAGQKETLK